MFDKNKQSVTRIDCDRPLDKERQADAYNNFMHEAQNLKKLGQFLVPGNNGSTVMSRANQRMIITKNDAFNTVRVHAVPLDENMPDAVRHDISVNGGKIMVDDTSYDDAFSSEYPCSSLQSGTQSVVETSEKILSMMSEDQINALDKWIQAERQKALADISLANAV